MTQCAARGRIVYNLHIMNLTIQANSGGNNFYDIEFVVTANRDLPARAFAITAQSALTRIAVQCA